MEDQNNRQKYSSFHEEGLPVEPATGILGNEPDFHKRFLSKTFKEFYGNDEILEDLPTKQMNNNWELLGQKQDLKSRNFKKWLQLYTKYASKHHEIDPETLFSRQDFIFKFLYLEKKSCLVEAYENGDISFTELRKKQKFVFKESTDKVVKMKANISQTILGLVYTNCIIFLDLSNYKVINTLFFYYHENISFAFNEMNQELVCMGLNLMTKCGLSVWNIKENRFEAYCNNNYESENIAELVYDKNATKVFFVSGYERKNLCIWYIKSNAIRVLDQGLATLSEAPGFLTTDRFNQNLYWGFWSVGRLLMVNSYSISEEGNEIKQGSKETFDTDHQLITQDPIDSYIYLEDIKRCLIKYDYISLKEIHKIEIPPQDGCYFLVFDEAFLYYNSSERKIYKLQKDKNFVIKHNLADYRESGSIEEHVSSKPFELDKLCYSLEINPFSRSLGAFIHPHYLFFLDFNNLKLLKTIQYKDQGDEYFLKVQNGSLFTDPDHALFFASSDENSLMIHQNIYSGKRNILFTGKRKIASFSFLNESLIYFSYENNSEILRWMIDFDYRSYSKFNCEAICSFEREVKSFSCLRNLNYFVINLSKTSSFVIQELIKGTTIQKKIELRGHTQEILDYQLIQDKNLMVSICKERKIVVWDLNRFEQINVILAGQFLKIAEGEAIESILFTYGEDGKYIAVNKGKTIYLWNLQNSFMVNFFQTTEPSKFLKLDSEKKVLYTFSSQSNLFQKWILEKNFNIFTKSRKGQLLNKKYYATFSPNFQYLLLEGIKSRDNSLSFMTWPTQNVVKEVQLSLNDFFRSDFFLYSWTKKNEGVLFMKCYTLIFIPLGEGQPWDIRNTNKIDVPFQSMTEMIPDNDDYVFYATDFEGEVYFCTMNLEKKTFSYKMVSENLEFEASAIAINPNFKTQIAVGTIQGELVIFDTVEEKIIRVFDENETAVNLLRFSKNGRKICSCYENSLISIWDVASESLESKLLGHKFKISFIEFSPDDSKLLSGGEDSTIRIWNLQTKSLERLIEIDEDIQLMNCEFCNNGHNIAAGFNEGMVLNLYGFEYYIQQSNAIFFLRNNLQDFEYLCSLFQPWNLNQLAYNFIHPFGFSLLHSLFYLGYFEELYVFIKILRFRKCRFTFFVDCTNKTIIDLLLEKNSTKLLTSLIEYMIEFPPTEDHISDQYHISILNLLNNPLPSIEVLLDSLIHPFKIKGDYYALRNSKQQKIFTITVKNIHPCLEEMSEKFLIPENPDENARLSFQIVNLKNVCDPKVNFCEKLKNYENTHKIFQSKFATSIIDYKWELYAKKIHINRFYTFFFFTLLATLNSYFFFIERICYTDVDFYAYASFVSEALLLVFFFIPYIWYELGDVLKSGFRAYFNEFWNWIDFFTMILFVFLFGIDSLDIFYFESNDGLYTALKMLHAFFIFVLWLKVLSFSIIYEGTAFIYTALIKIMQELRHFLLLLLLITIMLSFMVFILQDLYPDQDEDYDDSEYTKMTRLEILFVAYKMILGDYDDFFSIKPTLGTALFKILFILVTIVLFIILMNFIISLVSMVFSDVVAVKTLTYLYEKNKIIAEIDRTMSVKDGEELKQKKSINAFLMICQTNVPEDFDSTESQKTEKNSETEKTYLYTKIQNNTQDKIKFIFGTSCHVCKKELKEFEPQYYCYFCNIYFCAACGDKIDTKKKGSFSLIHPHNLVWIDVKNTKGMQAIDAYKLGIVRYFDDNYKEFQASCNGCRGGMDISRWICLSCRPGKYRSSGFIDFCVNCMDTIKKKDTGEAMKKIMKNLDDEDHENDSHIYMRVMFAKSYQIY